MRTDPILALEIIAEALNDGRFRPEQYRGFLLDLCTVFGVDTSPFVRRPRAASTWIDIVVKQSAAPTTKATADAIILAGKVRRGEAPPPLPTDETARNIVRMGAWRRGEKDPTAS
jgi:hypothetical protein